MIDPDEVDDLETEVAFKRRSKIANVRCQCDVEFGECPGVTNCPYSDYKGEEDE